MFHDCCARAFMFNHAEHIGISSSSSCSSSSSDSDINQVRHQQQHQQHQQHQQQQRHSNSDGSSSNRETATAAAAAAAAAATATCDVRRASCKHRLVVDTVSALNSGVIPVGLAAVQMQRLVVDTVSGPSVKTLCGHDFGPKWPFHVEGRRRLTCSPVYLYAHVCIHVYIQIIHIIRLRTCCWACIIVTL